MHSISHQYIAKKFITELIIIITFQNLYCTSIVKYFGGKKVWQIKTVESLAEKTWQIEVHLQRERYGKIGEKLDELL